jgi:GST-like protein
LATEIQKKPIELFYWPTPNGWKVSIMLEELGAPYETRFVNIGRGDQFDPAFLAIAPNNRMPAIIDPEGPDGRPISVFESGAILMYLGRKFGRFYPSEERRRVAVEEWLMWQMGNLGPMLGQNHHFRRYAPERIAYATERYENETHRLYGVLDRRLEGREFICDELSIADFACVGWTNGWQNQGIDMEEFSNVGRWLAALKERPAVQRGMELGKTEREAWNLASDKDAQKILFGQR